MRIPVLLIALAFIGWTTGCGGESRPDADQVRKAQTRAEGEPDYVTIRWIRVAFEGVPADHVPTRSRREAATRARDALSRASIAGADFAALAAELSDDTSPQAYGIANDGAAPRVGFQPREVFVPAVARAAFGLTVGAATIVEPDDDLNRHGYFVVMRTE